MNNEKYSKICPECGHVVYYKTIGSYYANRKKNSCCRSCKNKIHSQLLLGRKRSEFSNKWRRNLAIGHKKSETWKASMNSAEYCEKHRKKMIRLIKENKTSVGFNKATLPVFDYLNENFGWNGCHAGNGKEQVVDVFFLDFYEPTLNVAIEWDEKHHRKPSRHKSDWIKQKVVLDTLGCEFYRVDDVSKRVKKVDGSSNDRTLQIQHALNKYYETEEKRATCY